MSLITSLPLFRSIYRRKNVTETWNLSVKTLSGVIGLFNLLVPNTYRLSCSVSIMLQHFIARCWNYELIKNNNRVYILHDACFIVDTLVLGLRFIIYFEFLLKLFRLMYENSHFGSNISLNVLSFIIRTMNLIEIPRYVYEILCTKFHFSFIIFHLN